MLPKNIPVILEKILLFNFVMSKVAKKLDKFVLLFRFCVQYIPVPTGDAIKFVLEIKNSVIVELLSNYTAC